VCRFEVHEPFGFILSGLHELFGFPIVGNGKPQDRSLLGRHCAVDELAPFHVPPLIVRAMTPLWSLCAATARIAADFRTLQKRPRREVVHGVGVGSNAGDPFVCLFDYLFSLRWHGSDSRVRFGCVRLTQGTCRNALEALRRLIFFRQQSLLILADSLGRGQHGRSLQGELPWPLSIDKYWMNGNRSKRLVLGVVSHCVPSTRPFGS
jgi:hypothetical protein